MFQRPTTCWIVTIFLPSGSRLSIRSIFSSRVSSNLFDRIICSQEDVPSNLIGRPPEEEQANEEHQRCDPTLHNGKTRNLA